MISRRRGKRVHRLVWAGFTVFMLGNPAVAEQSLRPIMHQVLDALAYLLPLSMTDKDVLSDLDEGLVRTQVDRLQASASTLASHAQQRDPEFALLAKSFGHAVKEVQFAFDSDFSVQSRYALLDLTQNCVACHSRLPSDGAPPFGERLMARMDTDRLGRADVAQLYVATRQFESGLEQLEQILLDNQVSAVDIDIDGTLVRYLSINIFVMQDVERPLATLNRFLERGDVPYYLRRHVAVWQRSMRELKNLVTAEPSFAQARMLFDAGSSLARSPVGREALIYDLVAASLLRRGLEAVDLHAGEEIAEAYLMLGVITLRSLEESVAVPQVELLLASAIQAAPFTEQATDAYVLLEEIAYVDVAGITESTHPLLDMKSLRELVE